MYASTQKSNGPTRIIGASVAVLVTAIAGYVFSSGLAQDIVEFVENKTELAIIEAPKVELPPAPEEVKLEEIQEVEAPPELIPLPDFIVPEAPVIVAAAEPIMPVVDTAPIAPMAGSDRTGPKLRSTDKPPYPSASIRAKEQGATGLQVCVAANGRVQSASIAQPSGFSRLDDAALNWVRSARFAPGTIGGVPQSMCGHSVVYQWNLQDAT